MTTHPKIAFIGAGSTVFMKNIIGDCLQHDALRSAEIRLMDIDPARLEESGIVAKKLISTLKVPATVRETDSQRQALDGADFVIVAFQIGGFQPCTVTDFEIPKGFGLRQTIADTLGIGGIMRGLRTVPHLWSICDDMLELCPDAVMLQYVNPMAINCWAIAERYPMIKQVGLCHSVQHTLAELARDLDIDVGDLRYRAGGINHMAYFLTLEHRGTDGSFTDLYPALRQGYLDGRIPKPNAWNPRCPNKIRYDMMMRLGYFVTESSEHFAEYVPYYIKRDRPDLIERFGIPLDEYPKRCVEQIEDWTSQAQKYRNAEAIEVTRSNEYASSIIASMTTGDPSVIYGNVKNNGLITSLPDSCLVEVPCLVDANGIQPVKIGALPPQLTALMRTNINVQELTVAALIDENPDHIHHAAMMDPHTSAELDLDQIKTMVDALLEAHDGWLPAWCQPNSNSSAA